MLNKGGTTRYEWFLYLFPQKKFFKICSEISNELGINIWEVIQDELWVRGLVSERGSARMGKLMKGKIQEVLKGMEIVTRKHKGTHPGVLARQMKGLRDLEAIATLMGYTLIQNQAGLTMWNRTMGFMFNAGVSWVYVYKTGHSIQTTKQFPIVGYFHTNADNIGGKLTEAMNGDLAWKAYRHGVQQRLTSVRKQFRTACMRKKRKEA